MKRYCICLPVVAKVYVDVEAENDEQAKTLALAEFYNNIDELMRGVEVTEKEWEMSVVSKEDIEEED